MQKRGTKVGSNKAGAAENQEATETQGNVAVAVAEPSEAASNDDGAATSDKAAGKPVPAKKAQTEQTAAGAKTLSIDIGGSGVKMMVLDENGKPLTERVRRDTPQPAKPEPIVSVIVEMVKELPHFDRISVGFPGVVHDGVVYTAPNLDPEWKKFPLAETLQSKLHKPARVANDADVQGYGAIEGRGVELVITLGTGLGSALFVDGRLVSNLELGHHPFRKGDTYEEQLGRAALDEVGKKRWNGRVKRAIALLDRIINYRTLYIGGGNAKKLDFELPANVKTVSNEAGILGGIALWKY